MVDIIEAALNVSIHYPFFPLIRAAYAINLLYGVMGASAWTEAVAYPFKEGFPTWL